MWHTARWSTVRRLVGRLGHGAVLGACLLGLACDQSPVVPAAPTRAEPAPTPEPPPPQVNTAVLAGVYSLTVEFSSTCVAIPELSAPRKYQVSLEAQPTYLTVTIAGGGYPTPTVVGDLWPNDAGNSARLTWNNFDFPGCDGTPEPLSAGRALMVCGEGSGTVEAGTIRADTYGDVFIHDASGARQKVCSGSQRFTFTRVTAG